ncbi:Uncharacterised protein [Raoultella ornithinolytica]|nr:Uncharacterised protein [Raoultella ornithinolytica]
MPNGFGEIEFAARLGGAVFLDPLGRHHAGDRQTENRLRRVNRVATGQGDARLLAGKTPALHNFAGNFRRQGINRPAKNGNRHNRFSAHRENVADGVGGGDTAKVERAVDYRHKKVGGADDGRPVAKVVNRRIITGLIPHQQVRVDKLRPIALQNGFQYFRGNFTTTTGSVAVLR